MTYIFTKIPEHIQMSVKPEGFWKEKDNLHSKKKESVKKTTLDTLSGFIE